MKALGRRIAQREQITEAGLVKQLLNAVLRSSVVEELPPAQERVLASDVREGWEPSQSPRSVSQNWNAEISD